MMTSCHPLAPTPPARMVLHDYNDHAGVAFPSAVYAYLSRADAAGRGGPRGGVIVQFPARLHTMLSKAEEDGMSHLISWQPHGRCFKLHKPKEFASTILPEHFRHAKLTSFQRQLNLYGFSRITWGKDKGGYYHELFLKHRLFLCLRMSRTKIKGLGFKAIPSPDTEPDFYSMPWAKADKAPPKLIRGLGDEVDAVIEQENMRFESSAACSGAKKGKDVVERKSEMEHAKVAVKPLTPKYDESVITVGGIPKARKKMMKINTCPPSDKIAVKFGPSRAGGTNKEANISSSSNEVAMTDFSKAIEMKMQVNVCSSSNDVAIAANTFGAGEKKMQVDIFPSTNDAVIWNSASEAGQTKMQIEVCPISDKVAISAAATRAEGKIMQTHVRPSSTCSPDLEEASAEELYSGDMAAFEGRPFFYLNSVPEKAGTGTAPPSALESDNDVSSALDLRGGVLSIHAPPEVPSPSSLALGKLALSPGSSSSSSSLSSMIDHDAEQARVRHSAFLLDVRNIFYP